MISLVALGEKEPENTVPLNFFSPSEAHRQLA